MRISVSDLGIANTSLKQGLYDHVISFVDPGQVLPKTTSRHLILEAQDTYSVESGGPKRAQIDEALEFFKDINPREHETLFHCHAGISRSTAMAIGFLCYVGYSDEMAFKNVYRVRRIMWPNPLIISYFDDALDRKGGLIEQLKLYRKTDVPGGLIY